MALPPECKLDRLADLVPPARMSRHRATGDQRTKEAAELKPLSMATSTAARGERIVSP
jgi:hypothetical protein